jgi:hypothetical protein
MKGCNYCTMTIPCQCTVIGNNIQFDRKISLCNNETRDITTLYPVNLAVIQQFFNNSQLRKVLANRHHLFLLLPQLMTAKFENMT